MANSLRRVIKPGEVVIVSKAVLRPEFAPVESRRFLASGGFGMSNVTSGTALFGTFVVDGEQARMDGWDLDPEETAAWQAAHPEDVPA